MESAGRTAQGAGVFEGGLCDIPPRLRVELFERPAPFRGSSGLGEHAFQQEEDQEGARDQQEDLYSVQWKGLLSALTDTPLSGR